MLYDFFRKRTDASSPRAGLIHVGRTLYGTTFDGGDRNSCRSTGCGTVFSLTTGGTETGGTIGSPFRGTTCDDALAAVEIVELAALGMAGLAVVTARKSRLK